MVTIRRLLLALALLLPGAAFADGLSIGPSDGGGGSGGSGCVPSGGSAATNLVLYGTSGACAPDTNANASGGGLTLGSSGTQGSLILNGSSSGTATLNGGANGTFTSASPFALSGVFTLTGGSNALGTPLTLGLANATGLPISTGLTGAGTGVLAAMGNAVNGASGLLTFSIIGTSGATLGLLNANKTDSGNDTFSGTLTFSGLTTGTQVSCLGLTSGNLVAISTGACGSGGGSPAFSALTSGTNTTAAMHVGSGATLDATGSGAITATAVPLGGVTGLGANVGSGLANAATGSGAPVFAASPALTGAPTAPTASVGTNTTQIASTAFVQAQTVTDPICVTWDSTTGVTTQTVDFPIGWASYKIKEMKTKTLGGGSFTASVQIGGVGVTGCSVAVSGATNTNTPCTGANTGVVDDIISIVASSPSGTANQAYVCPVFVHTAN